MKTKIKAAVTLFCISVSLGNAADSALPPSETLIIKTEWLDKIYQANRLIETIDVWYNVFNESGSLEGGRGVVWDGRNKPKFCS